MVMTGGMAGIAGTVLVLYAQFLRDAVPDAAGHLIIASVLGAPIAVMIGQIMVPDENDIRTNSLEIDEPVAESTIDAIAKGATVGMALLLNMIAMLIVFVALVALVNLMLSALPLVGGDPITLERVLGLIMAPVCWLIGIPWSQAVTAGTLMGIKTVLNELIAYLHMSRMPADALDPRSRLIMLYAMCGFANFGSVGIMIGGLTVMAPERRERRHLARHEIDRVGHDLDAADGGDCRIAELAHRLRGVRLRASWNTASPTLSRRPIRARQGRPASELARSARMDRADRTQRRAAAHRQAGRCRRGACRDHLYGDAHREDAGAAVREHRRRPLRLARPRQHAGREQGALCARGRARSRSFDRRDDRGIAHHHEPPDRAGAHPEIQGAGQRGRAARRRHRPDRNSRRRNSGRATAAATSAPATSR